MSKDVIQRQRSEETPKLDKSQEEVLNNEKKVLTEADIALKELEEQTVVDGTKNEAKGLRAQVKETTLKEKFEGSTRSEMRSKEGFTTNVQTLLDDYVDMEAYGGIDGEYGPKTKEAVQELQRMINAKLPKDVIPLSPDGYFGPLTVEAYKKVADQLKKRSTTTKEDAKKDEVTDKESPQVVSDTTSTEPISDDLDDTEEVGKDRRVESKEIEQKTITLSEAQAMAKRELTPEEKNRIFRIEGANQPVYNFGETKKYFFLQGSATNDEVLLDGGARDHKFPYAITKNGLVVEFYDPTLGTAGVNDRASYKGDPFANARGMSVEFSAQEITVKRKDGTDMKDTEEPNSDQINAFTKTLRPYIQKNYPNIRSIGTSAEVAFDDNGLPAWSDAHTDTYNWSSEVLTQLGVTVSGRGEPTQADIKAYIAKLDEVIANPEFSGDSGKKTMLEESREFWKTRLDKK